MELIIFRDVKKHCRQPCVICIETDRTLADEERCKARRTFLNSRKFVERLECYNLTEYYKSRQSLINDHPVYNEIRTELENRLEEKDNDIDPKLAAHIL